MIDKMYGIHKLESYFGVTVRHVMSFNNVIQSVGKNILFEICDCSVRLCIRDSISLNTILFVPLIITNNKRSIYTYVFYVKYIMESIKNDPSNSSKLMRFTKLVDDPLGTFNHFTHKRFNYVLSKAFNQYRIWDTHLIRHICEYV